MGWLDDLLWLIYPELCASCDRALNTGEVCVCLFCRLHLPKTNYHLEKENLVAKHFWGKVPVHAAASYLHFTKGEKVQRLIHQLKYNGRKDVGVFFGEMYGRELKNSESFSSVELIIPVPLHAKKQRKRGYNQSDSIAEGLSSTMNIPFDTKIMRRNIFTDTQTRKHRYERFENVNRVFEIATPDLLRGKHVLLVDDVITTGSTLTSCAETILQISDTRVSIVSIAHA